MRLFARPVLVAVAVIAAVLTRLLRGQRNTIAETTGPVVELTPALGAYVEAVHRYGSEDEPGYQAAVASLRSDAASAARAITDAYRRAGDDDAAGLRETLLLAARALADPAVLPLLTEVARSPRRAVGQPGELNPEVRASKLRLMAVDGIEAIAASGDAAAWEALDGLVDSPDRAVQAAAVVAFTHGQPDGDRLANVRQRLPDDRRFLLDVRRADVRDVPQIPDPTKHLARPPRTADEKPDPDAPAGAPGLRPERAGTRRSPVVKGGGG